MAVIPDNYLDLLTTKKAFANIATVMKDGSPQVLPQRGQTYSYLSPSGRISSSRLRGCTAVLHLGQASRVASILSNAGRLCSFMIAVQENSNLGADRASVA